MFADRFPLESSFANFQPQKQQPHDAIDFTDNDIQVLGNFPLSPRIRTLLLARNRIAQIQSTLPNAIPNLKNLVLASNNIGELADLEVLGRFPRLTHLVLMDNPVTKKEVCPSVNEPGGGRKKIWRRRMESMVGQIG